MPFIDSEKRIFRFAYASPGMKATAFNRLIIDMSTVEAVMQIEDQNGQRAIIIFTRNRPGPIQIGPIAATDLKLVMNFLNAFEAYASDDYSKFEDSMDA